MIVKLLYLPNINILHSRFYHFLYSYLIEDFTEQDIDLWCNYGSATLSLNRPGSDISEFFRETFSFACDSPTSSNLTLWNCSVAPLKTFFFKKDLTNKILFQASQTFLNEKKKKIFNLSLQRDMQIN